MNTFTAAEVRELADSIVALIDDPERARQMLDAFATWLDVVSAFEPLDDKYREQGRREVLAEIAKIDPLITVREPGGSFQDCVFCGPYGNHKPDCLWLRAQQVTP